VNDAVVTDQGGVVPALRSVSAPTSSSEAAVSDHILRSLSHPERADLLRRLQMLTASEFAVSRRQQTARRWFIRFLAVCCISLIPWTMALGMSLPRTYVAANWRLLWTGFDVVLLGCLLVTAWGYGSSVRSCRHLSSRVSFCCAMPGSTCSRPMGIANWS
jgi:hypothetical protein